MKLDYGHVGFAANSDPDFILIYRQQSEQSANDSISHPKKNVQRKRPENRYHATIDIELDCSPLTRHDRPSSVHYAEAIVMPGAVIADYTVVMPI